jgi:hypothetical protein
VASLQSQKYDDAIRCCNAIITQTPKFPDPYYLLGAIHEAAGDPARALQARQPRGSSVVAAPLQ